MNSLPLKENLKKYTGIDSCPVRNIIARFSGKWSILVLCVLSENEATRFNEISKAIPDISPKVLTDTLKSLECDGLISEKSVCRNSTESRILPTEIGKSLIPHIENLICWAMDNYDELSKIVIVN